VVVAELALVAEIDDFLEIRLRQLVDVAIDRLDVDAVEQHLERRTQRQAPPAPRAHVEDAPHLLVDLPEVPELGPGKIERRIARHGHNTTSSWVIGEAIDAHRRRAGEARAEGAGPLGPRPARAPPGS
jgi:hypothetical protein